MDYDDATRKEFIKTKLLAIVLLVGAPIIYFIIAGLLKSRGSVQGQSGGEVELAFYILIVVAVGTPTILPMIIRSMIANYRSGKASRATPVQVMTVLYICKFAMVEATFVYGLVVFFLSGDLQRMLVFYPIGAIWSVIHWPRKERMKEMLKRLEGS